MSSLAENILSRLEVLRMTPTRASKEAGLGESAIRDIIIGKSKSPSIGTLEALCGVLECGIEDLVSGAKHEPEQPPVSKFFMVYGNGQRGSTYKHQTIGQACAEAKRLAVQNPGIAFIVLEAVEAFRAESPRVHTLGVTETDDIPF